MRVPSMLLALAAGLTPVPASAQPVPLSTLGRFDGWRENALIGYGLVTGLAGSGDTRQNEVTRQALRNVLSRLGTSVGQDQISSRNVAVVIVTARLPASANVGDRIDANVASIGDARSLAGGTLLMTPLMGPDGQSYALAQGALVTGGHSLENDLNRQQRNYPTSASLESGATIERPVEASIVGTDGVVRFLLNDPDFTTAGRIADAVNMRFGAGLAEARNADEVRIRFAAGRSDVTAFAAAVQSVLVEPARHARVVINERTGTIVAGGDVRISSVVVSQGDIRVTVRGQRDASQPAFIDGFATDVRSLVITNTQMDVDSADDAVVSFPDTSVGDLVQGLNQARVGTRRTIAILQAIKAAGALHADLIVQ